MLTHDAPPYGWLRFPFSGDALQQSTCQKILFEALACLSIDLFGLIRAAGAMDATQSASAINVVLNRI
jgi:hypothetical protein